VKHSIFLFITLLFAADVFAQDAPPLETRDYVINTDCADEGMVIDGIEMLRDTARIRACTRLLMERADSAVLRWYDFVLKEYKKEDAAASKRDKKITPVLIKAQQAWLTYRENHCNLELKLYLNDALSAIARMECQTKIAKQRILDLKRLALSYMSEPEE